MKWTELYQMIQSGLETLHFSVFIKVIDKMANQVNEENNIGYFQ